MKCGIAGAEPASRAPVARHFRVHNMLNTQHPSRVVFCKNLSQEIKPTPQFHIPHLILQEKTKNMKKNRLMQAGCILCAVLTGLLSGCAGTPQEETHPFDFYIDETAQEDIAELAGKPFAESVFSFTLMTFQRPGNENPQAGQFALLVAPSFDALESSPFNSASMKKEDREIMQDPEKHPILINDSLARAESLSVGDKFYQETRAAEEPMEFTVAGIYRQTPLFAEFDAVALANEQILSIFTDKVQEFGYTNAYIKASDVTAMKAYLDEEFTTHLGLEGLTEEQIAAIPKEDLKASYEEYDAHMNRMNGEA